MPASKWVLFGAWTSLILSAACAASDPGGYGFDGADSGASGSGSSGGGAGGGSSASGGGSGPIVLGDAGGGPQAVSGGDAGSATLTITIRDFKMYYSTGGANPDFENALGDDRGIVASALGADHKPVYRNAGGQTATTHGKMFFDQWYNDVSGVNVKVLYPVTLTMNPDGTYGYDSRVSGVALSTTDPTKEFFPIDDGSPYATPFGNQGLTHNYSFTTALHTVFTYSGGESFTFSGDDDVFVFINGQLVIDLGGVHTREEGTVSLDTLGLIKGQDYPLDFFGAERHTEQSNVSFTTSLHLRPAPTAL